MLRLLPPTAANPQVLVGLETGDDAGVYKLNEQTALVQSVDFFTPIVDDPYAYGQIAAANALSDLYAMGARPLTALNIVGYPIKELGKEALAKILQGGLAAVQEAGAVLLGGHSIDDPEPKYGLAVTGVADPAALWTNAGARPGDVLILTKPIGVGAITTGIKRSAVAHPVAQAAVDTMVSLNAGAAQAGAQADIHSCTDVTGYGLLGHALEMAQASAVALQIFAAQVPVLPGARELIAQGVFPGGTRTNLANVAQWVEFDDGLAEVDRLLLADAVTSGGLLFALPAAAAPRLQQALAAAGTLSQAIIGRVVDGPPGTIAVLP